MNNQEQLKAYLANQPYIRPLARTFKDSAVLYGAIAVTQTSFMLNSGLNDRLLNGDVNWLRASQGAIALANVSLTTLFLLYGRYQTYSDLRDLQVGQLPAAIVARADQQDLGKAKKTLNWAVANAFDINAWVSFPLCGLMIASGISSGRPGEALSGALLVWAYVEQLRKEKYGVVNSHTEQKKTKNWLGKKYDQVSGRSSKFIPESLCRVSQNLTETYKTSPLIVSSFIASWRLVPLAVNAAIKGDIYQIGQFATGMVMYVFKANTTKDGVGRYEGSVADPANEKALPVTRTLMEGRLSAFFKGMFTPRTM
jgi:hypothetical protein